MESKEPPVPAQRVVCEGKNTRIVWVPTQWSHTLHGETCICFVVRESLFVVWRSSRYFLVSSPTGLTSFRERERTRRVPLHGALCEDNSRTDSCSVNPRVRVSVNVYSPSDHSVLLSFAVVLLIHTRTSAGRRTHAFAYARLWVAKAAKKPRTQEKRPQCQKTRL